MTFDARAEAQTANLEPFPFIGVDGETYTLPSFLSLTERQMRQVVNDREGGLDAVLADLAPEALEAIMAMPVGVSRKLSEAWIAQAEEAGKESSASSPTLPAGQD